jgi:hypothetical protein
MDCLTKFVLIFAGAIMLGATPVFAGQVIAVGGDTGKTIAEGVAELDPGDTLRIQPGVYHTAIVVPCDNVTIESAGPGVILDGSVTLTASDFTPALGRPGVFTWHIPDYANPKTPWIFVDGQPLVFSKKPLDPAKQAWSIYVDLNTRTLEFVFDGKDVPANATIQVPVIDTAVQAWPHRGVTVRGLDIVRTVGVGISSGPDGIVEYNQVDWAGTFGIAVGEKADVTRNTTRFCCGPGIIMGGDAAIVEQNLVVANGSQWTDAYMNFCSTSIKSNARSFDTFRQNWIVDRPKGGLVTIDGHDAMTNGRPEVRKWNTITGLWPDTDSFNNNYIDNAIAGMSHAGVYIEYACNRNVIMANDIQDCAMGITMRESSENLITRNWVWDRECLGWGPEDKSGFAGYGPGYNDDGTSITKLYPYSNPDDLAANDRIVDALGSAMWGHQLQDGLSIWQAFNPTDFWVDPASRDNAFTQNLVQVNGCAVSVPTWNYAWPSAKRRQQSVAPTMLTNQLTANYYTRPTKDTPFALLGKSEVATFRAYQKATAWDGNARVGHFNTDVLGFEPLWTIPGLATDTSTPVSILYDPSVETMDTNSSGEPLFWHGTNTHTSWDGAPQTKYVRGADHAHSGHCYLSVTNVMNLSDSTPLEWRCAAIPVKEGISMGVDLWMAADNVVAARAGQGARVTLRFADATGHSIADSPVVGDGHHTELLVGTYPYTEVIGNAIVPHGACWMTVCLGNDPSTGTVRYDDIRINMLNPEPPSFPTDLK